MACGRSILAAILAGVLAACAGSVTPSAPANATPTEVAQAATANPTSMLVASPSPAHSLSSLSPSPTPRPTQTPTPDPVPPKPTGVKFDEHAVESDDGSLAKITQSVTWRTPRTKGVEIRIYGVTECIARPETPAPDTSGPCLVTHTALPASVRTLLGRAPASKGVVSWSWTEAPGCDIGLAHDPDGPVYDAIVLAAYNVAGNSIFAIAEPGEWWEPGPNDVIC